MFKLNSLFLDSFPSDDGFGCSCSFSNKYINETVHYSSSLASKNIFIKMFPILARLHNVNYEILSQTTSILNGYSLIVLLKGKEKNINNFRNELKQNIF